MGVAWGEMQDIKTHEDQPSVQLCPLGGLLCGVGVWEKVSSGAEVPCRLCQDSMIYCAPGMLEDRLGVATMFVYYNTYRSYNVAHYFGSLAGWNQFPPRTRCLM